MKKLLPFLFISFGLLTIVSWKLHYSTASIYDFSYQKIDSQDSIKLSTYKGKKILIVNVASKCGYTSQYEDLQKLQEKYSSRLVVIGFPCNQFLNQEPGTKEEILEFCKLNYGVTFPLSNKIDVKGHNQDPIYHWLTKKELNGLDDFHVSWNFNKFLIDENGKLLAHFDSDVKPLDEKITSYLK